MIKDIKDKAINVLDKNIDDLLENHGMGILSNYDSKFRSHKNIDKYNYIK